MHEEPLDYSLGNNNHNQKLIASIWFMLRETEFPSVYQGVLLNFVSSPIWLPILNKLTKSQINSGKQKKKEIYSTWLHWEEGQIDP